LAIQLRDYQKDAIREWIKNDGRGILAMATGAGKTLTALCLACKVAEQNKPLVIVVVCPFLNLATQWIREMAQFGLSPIACFHSREKWERLLQDAYQRVSAGLTDCMAVVVSNATFLSAVFQNALRPTLAQHLLIADEVHNLGAANLRNALPEGISLRLGLSATPERHGDATGTEAIFDYFGKVVFEFGIDRAIKEGVLVPYRYHPVLVDLTDDEAASYRELTARIARAWSRSEGEDEMDQLKMLLIKRARLLAAAANKLPALSKVLATHGEAIKMAIVYCGDGTVECPATAEVDRQILAVARLLGESHHLKVRKFTCDESSEDREGILAALRSGGLDAVVAIRCLDEGIDVPDVRLGFLLASSTNPRQFIQRRGRLLRRAPGKTRAVIYDFIVRPPDFGGESDANAFNVERRLFGRELERVLEFCRSAENGPIALQQLQDLRLTYNLLAH
jgi:DNA phosphorothioation system restriction enzyme